MKNTVELIRSFHIFCITLVIILFCSETVNSEHECYFEDYAHNDKEKGVKNISDYLDFYNRTSTLQKIELMKYTWMYVTNLTEENGKMLVKCSMNGFNWSQEQKKRIMRVTDLSEMDASQQRQVKFINMTLLISDSAAEVELLESISISKKIYSTGQVVLDNGTRLTPGENGPCGFFEKETDYDKLMEVWKKWRDVTGKKIRPHYIKQTKIMNKNVKENGYPDAGYADWYLNYEDEKFNEKVVDLYENIKPIYQELHAYARYKLRQAYPGRFPADGPIPAHLFRNLWAQDWINLFELLKPYRNVSDTDITKMMHAKNMTVKDMVLESEKFFTSIGLHKMTPLFWKCSIFEDPGDRPIDCHPSASDMTASGDFRIKLCSSVNFNNLCTMHHEMGHVEYYMSYAKQPSIFRDGANEAFHEAIGDTICLSVMTRTHLRKIGLYPNTDNTKENDLNQLLMVALQKVVILPFSLLVDTWVWRVFNGSIAMNELNKGWWRLRRNLQGVVAPVARSEEDLDPASKFHIADRISYIRYYISFIMQFQFYAALCKKSGHIGPLHQCDFYQSKPAGKLLRSTLELGASVDWPEALEKITGQKHVSTAPFEEYFSPLKDWLKVQRKTLGYPIGW